MRNDYFENIQHVFEKIQCNYSLEQIEKMHEEYNYYNIQKIRRG